jgi:hypothetical protein
LTKRTEAGRSHVFSKMGATVWCSLISPRSRIKSDEFGALLFGLHFEVSQIGLVRGWHTSSPELNRLPVKEGPFAPVRPCVTARVALSDDVLTRKTVRTASNKFHRVPHSYDGALLRHQLRRSRLRCCVLPQRSATTNSSTRPSTTPAAWWPCDNFSSVNHGSTGDCIVCSLNRANQRCNLRGLIAHRDTDRFKWILMYVEVILRY